MVIERASSSGMLQGTRHSSWARWHLLIAVMFTALQVTLLLSLYALPHEFTGIFTSDPLRVVRNWHMFIAVAAGLWGGLVIGVVTEYYTSNAYQPVKVRTSLHCGPMCLLHVQITVASLSCLRWRDSCCPHSPGG